jgi:enterochelin esterase-like enzyme
MIDQYIPGLKTYRAIAIEVGTKDGLLRSNKQLDEAMTRFGVQHTYEEYDGDHTNKVFDRIEMHVLPFFSRNLSFGNKNE